MIQITVIQIDNYGPWTVTPNPRRENDLQALQSRLYEDLNLMFGMYGGLVFYTRFDNLIAITNGISLEVHKKIQESVRNRYPFTISMAIASAETPYEAQKLATKTLQEYGSAQDSNRREVLDVANELVNGYVQIAHIDINNVTGTFTDVYSAYDTYLKVNEVKLLLMKEFLKYEALLFFIGGDNFMAPSNGMNEEDYIKIFDNINKKLNLDLKAGVGIGKSAEEAANLADIGLEEIRGKRVDKNICILKNDKFFKEVLRKGKSCGL
ncbi:GTP cyclohydrolase III [Methanocaldococcus infernus]|uniref:GTP cyclohydrolase III n=1 Tax=Methanocaldococcus infernus (strain DSM 11812 / JCM 15783 / ME) TaxID=573063 RepID=D5VQV8_METIM|nr:GTP cyclohydrolase IIa [Methanocaldococcus infernus]ADG12961.1 GTP cyclohydrolase IIa [Methanocaldococcus infernus ME]